MINYESLVRNLDTLKSQFHSADPFEHIIIDDFCNEKKLVECINSIPNPDSGGINKSRDYMFAKNKFEKSSFKDLSISFKELHDDLLSERFEDFLTDLVGEKVFVDPSFHGGGIHQGGKDSFLDMHVDFNVHPNESNWFRNLNILIYLNKDWEPQWKGELDLQHIKNKRIKSIEPIFNRCVIMFTRDYTVHGYKKINFPTGTFRRSIACYAYSLLGDKEIAERSTTWLPQNSSFFKSLIGKNWPKLVGIKTKLFGSGTGKNQ